MEGKIYLSLKRKKHLEEALSIFTKIRLKKVNLNQEKTRQERKLQATFCQYRTRSDNAFRDIEFSYPYTGKYQYYTCFYCYMSVNIYSTD